MSIPLVFEQSLFLFKRTCGMATARDTVKPCSAGHFGFSAVGLIILVSSSPPPPPPRIEFTIQLIKFNASRKETEEPFSFLQRRKKSNITCRDSPKKGKDYCCNAPLWHHHPWYYNSTFPISSSKKSVDRSRLLNMPPHPYPQ